jgi:hypothetical protein
MDIAISGMQMRTVNSPRVLNSPRVQSPAARQSDCCWDYGTPLPGLWPEPFRQA